MQTDNSVVTPSKLSIIRPAIAGLPADKTSTNKKWLMSRSCHVDGCPCPAFEDTPYSELCGNCGHKFDDHW